MVSGQESDHDRNFDIHQPIQTDYDFSKGEHRTMTFVFAKERSPEGIREALDNRRTAVYYRELVIGREESSVPSLKNA